jgi:hypothetical protein
MVFELRNKQKYSAKQAKQETTREFTLPEPVETKKIPIINLKIGENNRAPDESHLEDLVATIQSFGYVL